jgi:hypothetical protein
VVYFKYKREFKIFWKIALENWKIKKKKKKVFPSFPGFWPIGLAGCSAPPRLLLL